MAADRAMLQVGDVAATLAADFPGIVGYASRLTGQTMQGAGGACPFAVTVLDVAQGQYLESDEPESGIRTASVRAGSTYKVVVYQGDLEIASLDVAFQVDGSALRVSSTIRSEVQGWELASTRLQVFTVPRDLPGAALALPTRSGRLVELAGAVPERAEHKVSWFEPAPIAIAAHDGFVGVLWLDTVDSQFIHEVTHSHGSLTVELIHRHRAEKTSLSFLAQPVASCTLRFATAADGARLDWTDGAALVRDTIPAHLQDLYVGAVIYKVMLQAAGSEDVTTYSDVFDLIRRVERITGGARQIVYVIGWQHEGHDTGYPDVYTPNLRVGTFADFQALKERAKAHNAIVSLHDNVHDAYLDSPLWDPAIVCVNPDGNLRKGGIWGGGQAYEIGPTKYVEQAVIRAGRTVEMMGLEQTTHLDVLSDKPDMVDFDPVRPASREQNAEAKRLMVEAFRAHGVDVTSEVLTSPFTPWMHHFWHVERRPEDGWGPHERIPLVPFLYHGKVTAGGDASTDAAKLDQIEYGWTFSADWSKETTDDEIASHYNLVTVPWSLLARQEIVGFGRDGDWEKVVYAPDTYVRVNRAENRYEVMVDGVAVARDFVRLA